MWGTRVVIPPPGRTAVLQELHEGHPGISKMKALARMYVWWPGMNADIEKSVRRCGECQQVQSSPPPAPLNPWRWPSRPWARLHLDFAGPFQGKTILVLIDAHSKWIEAVCTPSTSSASVINELQTLFAKFGLPETIVTDNGTGFTSQEFKSYLKDNGVQHVTSSPYHPSSNGLAERAVQIVKRGLKKVNSGSMSSRIAQVLFTHRITRHNTTGISPAELLLGRRLRTKLDLIRPNTAKRVEEKQDAQKAKHDSTAKARVFQLGDKVYVKNFGSGQSWLPAEVVKITGPVSFHVRLADGRTRRCHQDHVRAREGDEEIMEDMLDDTSGDSEVIPLPEGNNSENVEGSNNPTSQPLEVGSPISAPAHTPTPTGSPEQLSTRYPRRHRKKREHFEPSQT